ncbi:transcriptional regulator, LacI family [Cellulosimicrobium cellulans]|nr:transcriptional regulator, LacI family [Cellulosimicrobium cellulans]
METSTFMANRTRSDKPSQRDIAQAAGVSQATVSFVLNNRSAAAGISEDTQRRVQETAQRLGYAANVAAQSLRGGRTGPIGVHTYEPIFPASPDHYYHQFLIGLEEEATELGVDLVLFTSAHQPAAQRSVYLQGHNRMRLADGAVILGSRKDDAELRRLSEEGFPIVSVGRPPGSGYPIASVVADYRTVLIDAVGRLAAAGHSRTLYVGHLERRAPRGARYDGYLAGCQTHGVSATEPAMIDPAHIDAAWLTEVTRSGITALVAETTAHAQAVYSAAAAGQIAVPRDLSLVSLDVSSNPSGFLPWSHIGVPRYEMGRRSLRVLSGVLEGTLEPDHAELVACEPTGTATIAPARPL